jgi:hypothetical protein
LWCEKLKPNRVSARENYKQTDGSIHMKANSTYHYY